MKENVEFVADVAHSATEPLADEVASLFQSYRGPLLRYLLSMGLPIAVSEEIAQEVFLSLFQHLRQGKSRAHLRGWIFRVGHNLALKERQRATRRPQTHLDEQRACSQPNPEQSAAAAQRHRRLMAIVQALPAQDQHCLHLRAEGLTYREIAHVLGVSLGSVAMILSRSLLKATQAEAL